MMADLVRFSGNPAVDTLVSVGKFQWGTRYLVLADIRPALVPLFCILKNGYQGSRSGAHPQLPPLSAESTNWAFDINQKITDPDISSQVKHLLRRQHSVRYPGINLIYR